MISRKVLAAPFARFAFALITLMLVGCASAVEPASKPLDPNDLSFYRPPVTTAPYPQTSAKEIRNVIFCIGDGMGINTVTMTSMKVAGMGGRLNMERMPVTGLVRTYSASAKVTDSAAAGTALSCGIKTKNGMIGFSPEEKAYQTILEAAKARGMATGLVATSTITHATPASFASHVSTRSSEAAIAEQLLANRVNVLFGGGRKYFLPKADPNSGRKDDRDLIAEAKQAGYSYVTTERELRSVRDSHVLGLFQFDALTTQSPEPSLGSLTRKAIRLLKAVKKTPPARTQGFFLMVEGSQIDWACTKNDVKGALRQTLLFDEAVQAAVEFALRDGHTLVIVTADHETGGLIYTEPKKDETNPTLHWAAKGHSGGPVMIGALGPGSTLFTGIQDNTDIPKKIAHLLGIKPFPRPVE